MLALLFGAVLASVALVHESGQRGLGVETTAAAAVCIEPELEVSFSRSYWGSFADYLTGSLSVEYSVTNTGSADAVNIQLTGTDNSAGVETSSEQLPMPMGDLASAGSAGDSLLFTVIYSVPQGISSFRSALSAQAEDTCGNAYLFPISYEGDQEELTYTVVDTGQDLCYDDAQAIACPAAGSAFSSQDGQQTGNTPSYTDNGDSTVTDNNTGLIWTQSPDLDGDGEIDVDDKLSLDEALAMADSLTTAGYSDWRLPDIKELYSLIDFSGLDPSGMQGNDTSGLKPFIDTDYFAFEYGDTSAGERVIDAQFVSSTEYVSTTMNNAPTVFGVNFADGRIKGYPSDLMPGRSEAKQFYVLFVRGNSDYGENRFTDNGDGTVTDNATGLMWMQDDSGALGAGTDGSGALNWQRALNWAENLNYAGYDDWRLPDAKELQSIVDYSRSPDTTGSAAIDPVFNTTAISNEEGVTDYPFFWSSTTHANVRDGTSAAYVSFGRAMGYMNGEWMDVHGAGAQRSDPKSGDPADWPYGHGPQGDVIRIDNYARCVRTAETVDDGSSGGDSGDDPGISDGFNLFAPMGSTTTYLIDSDGNDVHTWASSYQPGNSVYLMENGNLLRTGSTNNGTFQAGGAGGVVQELAWDGTVLWEYQYSSDQHLQHHDIEPLPNGNVLMIAWEYRSEAEALAAGRDPAMLGAGELWPDTVIEVEPTGPDSGEIVWKWSAWDHLVQDYDSQAANYGDVAGHPELIDINLGQREGKDWTHVNSVDYNTDLDQILLSSPRYGEVWIIDHSTSMDESAGHSGGERGHGGDLIYRWGNPANYGAGSPADKSLFGQHDAEWIAEGLPGAGDILVYNNGTKRPGGEYSSVDQFTPAFTDDGDYTLPAGGAYGPESLSWVYTASDPLSLYSQRVSGAQRLPNGNTLVCDGPSGYFFEVTPAGEIVWEHDLGGDVFRVTRYPPDYPGLTLL